MAIYEFKCSECGTCVEKFTKRMISPPSAISEPCEKCGRATKHVKMATSPAFLPRKSGHQLREMLPPKDKSWKKRVLEGRNPDGRPLTNRVAESAKWWGVDPASRNNQ